MFYHRCEIPTMTPHQNFDREPKSKQDIMIVFKNMINSRSYIYHKCAHVDMLLNHPMTLRHTDFILYVETRKSLKTLKNMQI